MNRVGREGRGESTWMGFFLVSTIDAFLPYARARGDETLVATLVDYRARMHAALNDTGPFHRTMRRVQLAGDIPA